MKKRKTAGRPVSPNAVTGFEALHNPARRDQALTDLGQWVVEHACYLAASQKQHGRWARHLRKG